MATNVTNEPIHSVFQRMQADMSERKFDMRNIKVRMTMGEQRLGGTMIGMSGVNSRLDRPTDRVERIENRLNLAEAR